MNRMNKFIMAFLIIFLLVVIGVFKFNFNSGYKISITNNTSKAISNIELKYKSGNTVQAVSQINPKKSWKYNIDTMSIQGENSIILTYKDDKGISYEECIVGYLEKGYSGHVYVSINKVDESGKLEIKIK